jgi:hypothetical protein
MVERLQASSMADEFPALNNSPSDSAHAFVAQNIRQHHFEASSSSGMNSGLPLRSYCATNNAECAVSAKPV